MGGVFDRLATVGDKRQWESDQRLVEQQKELFNLQNHANHLAQQLERMISLMPELRD